MSLIYKSYGLEWKYQAGDNIIHKQGNDTIIYQKQIQWVRYIFSMVEHSREGKKHMQYPWKHCCTKAALKSE